MDVLASTPSFSESSLTVTPSVRKTGPVGSGFLNSRSLPESCVRVSLAARRIADLDIGRGSAARRLLGRRGLLDQRQRDVGVGVFLIVADELPQIDLVGDGDLRLARRASWRGLLGFASLSSFLRLAAAAFRARPEARRVRPAVRRDGRRAAPGRQRARRARSDRPTRSAGAGPIGRPARAGPIGRAGPPGPIGRRSARPGPGARRGGSRPAAGPRGTRGPRRRGRSRRQNDLARGSGRVGAGAAFGASASGSEATTAVRAGSARRPSAPRPRALSRGGRGFGLGRGALPERPASRRS